jgi:hypothetical protein
MNGHSVTHEDGHFQILIYLFLSPASGAGEKSEVKDSLWKRGWTSLSIPVIRKKR